MSDQVFAALHAVHKSVETQRRKVQAIKGVRPFARNVETRKLRALEEAERDVLNTAVTNFGNTSTTVDKNNYNTYAQMVRGAYEMYEGRSDYGAELFGGVVDMRVSFIGGEGISVTSKNKAAQEFAENFLQENKMQGSTLIDILTTGELEGRNLLTLTVETKKTGLAKDKDTKYICVDEIQWQKTRYQAKEKNRKADTITYKDADSKEITVSLDKSVYVVLGRRLWSDCNSTPNRLHKVLTDFENFSRAKYDLRNNTHLFGRVMNDFETKTREDAEAINRALKASDWKIGDGYVGPAVHKLLEPTGSAGASIEKDALMALKLISSASGIPMHWLAWPELMSNRATADSLIEVVNAATLRERLVWQEALKELIIKAAIMAAENIPGTTSAIIDPDIDVQMSLVSLAMLKQIAEVWLPLVEAKIISKHTYYSRLPGNITYDKELELINEEAEDAAERSPMQNGALDDALKTVQENNKTMPGAIQNKKNTVNQEQGETDDEK